MQKTGIREEGFIEGREAGLAEGHEAGLAEGRKAAIITSIQILREVNISKETVLQQIMEKYELTKEEAEKVVNSHWE